MSSKIDERIVGMKFQGDQFQKGVADTSKALEKLKQGLNLGGAAKGMKDLDASAKNFSLANLANGVQDIASKFGALSVIGITALANIANKAVDAGLTIMRSLTIDPIKAGFDEYELKMGSIQTILANTERYGTTLGQVTSSLDELNTYADKTIYNFGDMTKNIGLFTNAGIKIEDATAMIQGFSNVAAASGTSAAGAAGAAYQLSQALSAGTIRLMDWRSLTNVGMGNKNMQNGLIEIADAMGMLSKNSTSATEIQGNFNASLEKNWLSADVMSNYLKIMAGDMSDAEMAALGLSKAQVAAFKKSAQTAEDAATKVRTFTQLYGTLQEGVGSGWAQTFDILIGDFDQATEMWTAVNDELGEIIGGMSDARNKLLQAFVDGGGRDYILGAIANIWNAAKMYLMPIQSAFKEIFPPITAKNLLDIAKNFSKFAESLKPSAETMKLLKRTFMGVFAVLDIGWMVLQQIIGLFGRLFGAATEGAGGILEVTASIGDFLVKTRDSIKNGTALTKVFEVLGDVLQKPIEWLRKLGAMTLDIIGTWNFAAAWEAVGNAFKKVGEFLGPVFKWLGEFFANAKEVIGEFFKTMDFNVLVGLLNLGALGGIGIGLKKAFDFLKGRGIMGLIFGDKKESSEGMIDKIKGVFGALTDTFSELQNTLKSATLIGIGVAIALITASVVALSFVDTGKLFIVLGAMTVMFGQLSAMLLAIDKLTKTVKTSKVIGVSIALGLLAGAMLLMSAAVLVMSTMDWVELARGLSGMAVGLGLLVGAAQLLSKMSGKLYFTAPALVMLATAMLILSGAMKIFSTMSWDDIIRSTVALGGALAVMVAAMSLVHSKIFAAASMIILAVAVNILAGAMKVFSTMSWDEIGRAVVAFAGAMAVMVIGMALMAGIGPTAVLGAAAMVIAATGITILAGALKIMATMSWDEIGRSMVVLAGGLGILAVAMALMGVPLVALGGLALLVVSAGLTMLAPALVLLGTMSWDAIGRGLTMLGGALAILAVGGLLLIPASVGFLLLGTAIALLGAGVLMAATGVTMFAAAILALAAAGAVGAEALKMAVQTMIGLIPEFMAAFAQGIIDFALVIAGGATEFTAAMTTLIQSLMMAIQENGPLVIDTIWILIVALVDKIVEGVPFFVDSGMKLVIGVMDGIANNVHKLVTSGTKVITEFIRGIGDNAHKVVTEAGNTLLKFVNGLSTWIDNNRWRMISAANKLIKSIVEGIAQAIENSGDILRWAGQRIGDAIIQGAKNFLGINSPSKVFRDYIMGSVFEGIEKGNDKNIHRASAAGNEIGNALVHTATKSLAKIRDAVASDMDFDPTIRPVLDLSAIRKDSQLIGGMLTPPTLKVEDSYAYASSIATERRASEETYSGDDNDEPPHEGDTYNFYQTNNSPKTIPAAELYRQSNNLLSVIKKGKPTGARQS